MDLIAALCVGVIIGVLIMALIFKPSSAGKLHIMTDKHDGSSYMYLELSKDVSSVRAKKFVTFEVTQK